MTALSFANRCGWLCCLVGFVGCFQSTINSASLWRGPLVNQAGDSDPPPNATSAETAKEYTCERGQLKFYSNFYLPPTHPMIEEMVALRDDVFARIDGQPGPEPIHVYLFRSPLELAAATEQLGDPIRQRRAYFLQTADSLNVFTSWSYDVAEDLRHELTHGYVHSVCPQLPLWMDEGLAEYFEVPRTEQGLHLEHLRLLVQYGLKGQQEPLPEFDWRLSRLESLTDPASLTQMDYALSWLWVATLLSSPAGSKAIAADLQARQAGEPPTSLLTRLGQDEGQAIRQVQKHLQGLVVRHRHRL